MYTYWNEMRYHWPVYEVQLKLKLKLKILLVFLEPILSSSYMYNIAISFLKRPRAPFTNMA